MLRAISFQDFQSRGLRKTIFPQECISAVQGHPRSLILVPIESSYGFRNSPSVTLIGPISHRFGDIAGFMLRN